MEAMASGLPIVSTAAGGVPDLFENGNQGLLVPPGGCQALSKAMTFLLRNHDARYAMGLAAARHAREKFDVSTMVRAYEETYEQLFEQDRHLKAPSALRESVVPAGEAVGNQSR
jgi:glycosyltransferase involved in cell wall biosynthesis